MKLGDSGPTRRLEDEEKPRSCTLAVRPPLRKSDIAAFDSRGGIFNQGEKDAINY